MKNSPETFYLAARKIWNTVFDRTAPETFALELQLELHKQLLNIFQVGHYYYFIFNIPNAAIELMSTGVTPVLGYAPEEMDLAFFLDIIHPEDKPYFLNYESKIATFYKELAFDKIHKYKTQYDMRLRARSGDYVRVLHQAVQVEYDADNFYRTFDLQTDISHIKQHGGPTFSIIGMDGEPSYYNITGTGEYHNSYNRFTAREREILQMIVGGASSEAIAGQLHISVHTVHTHRKHILQKAGCTTPIELVRRAITEGWI